MGLYYHLDKRRIKSAYYVCRITFLNKYNITWGYIHWFTSLWEPVMLFYPLPINGFDKGQGKESELFTHF